MSHNGLVKGKRLLRFRFISDRTYVEVRRRSYMFEGCIRTTASLSHLPETGEMKVQVSSRLKSPVRINLIWPSPEVNSHAIKILYQCRIIRKRCLYDLYVRHVTLKPDRWLSAITSIQGDNYWDSDEYSYFQRLNQRQKYLL